MQLCKKRIFFGLFSHCKPREQDLTKNNVHHYRIVLNPPGNEFGSRFGLAAGSLNIPSILPVEREFLALEYIIHLQSLKLLSFFPFIQLRSQLGHFSHALIASFYNFSDLHVCSITNLAFL